MAGKQGRSGGLRVAGSGHGGARAGSGQKGLDRAARWLRWQPGSAPGVPVPGELDAAVTMPALPAEAAMVWAMLAPHAIAEGLLVPATAFAFGMLCRGVVLEAEIAADPSRRGGGDHRGVWQRLEISLARFRLTADGRAHVGAAPVARPLSELEQLQEESAGLRRPRLIDRSDAV